MTRTKANLVTEFLILTAATVLTGGCTDVVDYSEITGAHEGESFTLSPNAPTRSFETRICAEFSGPGQVELEVNANVEHQGSTSLTVELVSPVSPGPESFPIMGRSRVESSRLVATDDPETTCRDGVQILFEADESIRGPMTVQWEVNYKVAANYDLGFGGAVRIYDLEE
ncbi:MAG: hypothetical protein AAF721_16695 [Myxococcota bacterium]